MEWAHEHPERMTEIAALPLSEQHAALCEAMLPELLGPHPAPVLVSRCCRACGDEFLLSANLAAKPRSKWTSLCSSCLVYEI